MTLAALVSYGPRKRTEKLGLVSWVLQLQGAPWVCPPAPAGSGVGRGWAERTRAGPALLTLKDEELAPVLPQTVGNGAAEEAVLSGGGLVEPALFCATQCLQADP